MAIRVMSFMAHPDDAEFMCAGTMIRLKEEAGCEIIIATATSGDGGTAEHRVEDIARIRHAEARSAAAVIGAEYHAAGSRDLFVLYDEPTLRRFIEVIRKARPDIVITHPPSDYIVDHEMTSKLVRTAVFSGPIPNAWTGAIDPAPVTEKVPHLYYADPVTLEYPDGRPAVPDFVVDITATIETKQTMLACHASQRNWLRKHHDMDEYIEMMKRMSGGRGELIGRRFAEGFRLYPGHPYPKDNRIADLLGDCVMIDRETGRPAAV